MEYIRNQLEFYRFIFVGFLQHQCAAAAASNISTQAAQVTNGARPSQRTGQHEDNLFVFLQLIA